MASLLGTDKHQIKASSDIHLSFFLLFYLTFFQEKRCYSDSKHKEPQQRFSYHDLCWQVVRLDESKA